jgi:hypothetical protein
MERNGTTFTFHIFCFVVNCLCRIEVWPREFYSFKSQRWLQALTVLLGYHLRVQSYKMGKPGGFGEGSGSGISGLLMRTFCYAPSKYSACRSEWRINQNIQVLYDLYATREEFQFFLAVLGHVSLNKQASATYGRMATRRVPCNVREYENASLRNVRNWRHLAPNSSGCRWTR